MNFCTRFIPFFCFQNIGFEKKYSGLEYYPPSSIIESNSEILKRQIILILTKIIWKKNTYTFETE